MKTFFTRSFRAAVAAGSVAMLGLSTGCTTTSGGWPTLAMWGKKPEPSAVAHSDPPKFPSTPSGSATPGSGALASSTTPNVTSGTPATAAAASKIAAAPATSSSGVAPASYPKSSTPGAPSANPQNGFYSQDYAGDARVADSRAASPRATDTRASETRPSDTRTAAPAARSRYEDDYRDERPAPRNDYAAPAAYDRGSAPRSEARDEAPRAESPRADAPRSNASRYDEGYDDRRAPAASDRYSERGAPSDSRYADPRSSDSRPSASRYDDRDYDDRGYDRSPARDDVRREDDYAPAASRGSAPGATRTPRPFRPGSTSEYPAADEELDAPRDEAPAARPTARPEPAPDRYSRYGGADVS